MTDVKTADDLTRRLGDSFAVALLQWPPLVAALLLDGGGWLFVLRIACLAWVGLVGLALIFGRGQSGPQWGLAMALCAGCVAAAVLLHPGVWMAAPMLALLFGIHAALKIRLTEHPAEAPSDAAVPATPH